MSELYAATPSNITQIPCVYCHPMRTNMLADDSSNTVTITITRARVLMVRAATITASISENQASLRQLQSGADENVVASVASSRNTTSGRNSSCHLNLRPNSNDTPNRIVPAVHTRA